MAMFLNRMTHSPIGSRTHGDFLRLGDWITVRTKDIHLYVYYPFTRTGANKSLRFEPHVALETPWGGVCIHGKRALWSFLDALFPNNPLPRKPVNEDLRDENGGLVIEGLLKDPDAWPFLRLNVRDGEHFHPFGGKMDATWVLAASAASSDSDVTSTLLMLERGFQDAFVMPLTLNAKTRIATVPAVFIPTNNPSSRVIVTDAIEGNHLIFSIISHNACNFRPERFDRVAEGRADVLTSEIEKRIGILNRLNDASIEFQDLRPLSPTMRFTEVDDLEHRRFLTLPGAASFVSNLGVSGIN